MGKSPRNSVRIRDLMLVVEVVSGWEGEAECVAIIASLPERPDTLTVTYPVHLGGMRVPVLEDLMLEVDQLITFAVEASVGVQEVLPLA